MDETPQTLPEWDSHQLRHPGTKIEPGWVPPEKNWDSNGATGEKSGLQQRNRGENSISLPGWPHRESPNESGKALTADVTCSHSNRVFVSGF